MALSRQLFRATRLLEQGQRLFTASQPLSRSYAAGSNELRLTLVSPTDIYYTDVEVKQVDVPGIDSNFGIVKQHVPTLAVMKPGVVQITEMSGTINSIFVSSGSITVNEDSTVHILAEEAHPLDRFDRNAAKEALNSLRGNQGTTPEERMEAEIALNCLEEINKAI